MSFKQITINIDSDTAEMLSDIFFKLGALSVSTEDQYEGTPKEQPIFNEPGMEVNRLWEYSKLTILFDNDADIDKIIAKALELAGKDFTYKVELLDDQDWVRLTQSQFRPIKINDKLYIVPSWHELPDPQAVNIILDPGLAFGTGTHATTFMCLKWLAHNIKQDMSVLDYGCGSGILAITAKKLGAVSAVGLDIDQQAIQASRYNAQNNNAEVAWYLPQQLPNSKFDIVVANILSNPLRILAPVLASHTSNTLILSGILESQVKELSEIYRNWFQVTIEDIMDGWALLQCKNKNGI